MDHRAGLSLLHSCLTIWTTKRTTRDHHGTIKGPSKGPSKGPPALKRLGDFEKAAAILLSGHLVAADFAQLTGDLRGVRT